MTDHLEPAADHVALDQVGGWDSDQQRSEAIVQTSIAISLKRIADALDACTDYQLRSLVVREWGKP